MRRPSLSLPNMISTLWRCRWSIASLGMATLRLRLAEAGIARAVGSVGDSYDNALAETINSLYKAEVIHRRRLRRSFEAVEYATLEWVDWFNHRRLLEPIGTIPPAEAEEQYYAMIEQQPPAIPARFIPRCVQPTMRQIKTAERLPECRHRP
jgi:transposase InsO family protein